MKEKVQVFGRFLSGMVMPNIGAFIAWGFITMLFIPSGWFPNETLAKLVDPMSHYLLPLLIAYTGGKMVHGRRGAVVGAISAMGVIVATDIPMFLGAMIMGPLSAWLLKKFDELIDGHVKSGFEMLVDNFSIGIIGAIIVCLAMLFVAPLVEGFTNAMAAGVNWLVSHGLLLLTSIIIEPAKILFLNNAINHGILSPLGIEQVAETGKSIFFLLESNPGPGLGVLLAYWFFGKGEAKESAPSAVIIEFFGGIHEIYFPYVLMNPLLLLSVIGGGMTGIAVESLFNVGLVAPASPGSILAILAMCAKGSHLGVLLGIGAAAAVSFFISMPILKFSQKEGDLKENQEKVAQMKAEAKGAAPAAAIGRITNVVFACDAGMGSSAMGASVLKRKFKDNGLEDVAVSHASVSEIPEAAQVVVTHKDLRERAAHSAPQAQLVLISNFMAAPEYDELVEELKKNKEENA